MAKAEWPSKYPVDYIKGFLGVDPKSPSGLCWRVRPNLWVKQFQQAGYKTSQGWVIQIEKRVLKCDHIILLLSGHLPEPKQVVLHLNADKYDNRLENLVWASRSSELFKKQLSDGINKGMRSYEKEIKNLGTLMSRLRVDPTSPTGLSWLSRGIGQSSDGVAGGKGPNGLYYVTVDKETYSCARLVLILSGFEPKPKQVALHIDADPLNNKLSNLKWATRSEMSSRNGQMTNRKFKNVRLINGEFHGYYTPPKKGARGVFVGKYDTPEQAQEAVARYQRTLPAPY
jgi:hypothetical protein